MEGVEKLEFLSNLDKKKIEIFKELESLKRDLDDGIFMLGSELYKHNVSVSLINVKRKVEHLISELKE